MTNAWIVPAGPASLPGGALVFRRARWSSESAGWGVSVQACPLVQRVCWVRRGRGQAWPMARGLACKRDFERFLNPFHGNNLEAVWKPSQRAARGIGLRDDNSREAEFCGLS